MATEQYVSLENLGEGAAVERFDHALSKVLENIQDLNTPAVQKREISLKMTIVPDEDRERGVVEIKVEAKLAGAKGLKSTIYFGVEGSRPVARESNPRQPRLYEGNGASGGVN